MYRRIGGTNSCIINPYDSSMCVDLSRSGFMKTRSDIDDKADSDELLLEHPAIVAITTFNFPVVTIGTIYLDTSIVITNGTFYFLSR